MPIGIGVVGGYLSVSIGAPSYSVGAYRTSDLIHSIRDQIPDRVDNADDNGGAFPFATLLRWINDATRTIATITGCIWDWTALQSVSGMDVYELPQTTLSVEQVWFDRLALSRSPEAHDLGLTKVTGRTYSFGPHALHAQPRLHVWPAPNKTGAATTLSTGISATDTTLALTDAAGFNTYGWLRIGNPPGELVLYRTLTGNTVTNILRGQGGTVPALALSGVPVTDTNLWLKMTRLAAPLRTSADLLELPQALLPLVELYVLSKVREAEQDHQTAAQMRQEFVAHMDKLGANANVKGLRQGIQVTTSIPAPFLYGGRVIVP